MTRHISPEQHAEVMRFAFDQVCDPEDWKAPIDVIVPYMSADLYAESIKFMTATTPEQIRTQTATGTPAFRLVSIGYRAGPAGP